jgi:predicted  nucleic acid-binding Zn-ribbon protein
MYEIGKSGNVLRKIDPTPTPEQVKVQQEEYERVKASLKIESEQKRKDMALLSTFSSEREFDMARERNIEPLNARIASARDRLAAVDKRAAEIEEEMEFYKAGKSKAGKTREMPAGLTADLQRVRHEKTVLVASIANYEKEIEQTRAKFDADKKRWLDIKRGGGSAKAPESPPADAKPAKKN